MKKHLILKVVFPLLAILLIRVNVYSQDQSSWENDPRKKSDEWKIENALSALPYFLREDATVLDWPTDAEQGFRTLKKGTDKWVCYCDRAATPSNDPMCHDEVFNEWMMANAMGKTPKIERIGFSYMLRGGSAADQKSPFITKVPEGRDWYYMGPHVMVIVPDKEHLIGINKDVNTGELVIEGLGLEHPNILFPIGLPGDEIKINKAKTNK